MDVKEVGANSNPYRHILVALDGSALAERVLPFVESLAQQYASTVTLLQVVIPVEALLFAGTVLEPIATRRYAELEQANAQARADAVGYLASLADRIAERHIAVNCAAPEGPPATVIVEEAQRRGTDLIAMTTQGRGGLSRVMFGSVAEDVLRHAPCPVLLMRVGDEAEYIACDGPLD